MKSAREIRDGYLDYFRELEHAVVPSASTIPRNDPTLLFTNAGMSSRTRANSCCTGFITWFVM